MNVPSPFMQLYSTFTNPFPGYSPMYPLYFRQLADVHWTLASIPFGFSAIIGKSLIGENPESRSIQSLFVSVLLVINLAIMPYTIVFIASCLYLNEILLINFQIVNKIIFFPICYCHFFVNTAPLAINFGSVSSSSLYLPRRQQQQQQ